MYGWIGLSTHRSAVDRSTNKQQYLHTHITNTDHIPAAMTCSSKADVPPGLMSDTGRGGRAPLSSFGCGADGGCLPFPAPPPPPLPPLLLLPPLVAIAK
jgi:hypothetical protein